jgi:hypothetical protein
MLSGQGNRLAKLASPPVRYSKVALTLTVASMGVSGLSSRTVAQIDVATCVGSYLKERRRHLE